MYKNVMLTAKYLDFFAPLDPYNFLAYGALPDRVCIGTALVGETEEKAAKDTPVGLMVCRLTKGAIVVEWIYVDAGHRFNGIGASLMKCAFEESKKRGFPVLYAYISPLEERDKVCPFEQRFMEDYRFSMLRPGKGNKKLFMELIPEEHLGSDLYQADVAGYFDAVGD